MHPQLELFIRHYASVVLAALLPLALLVFWTLPHHLQPARAAEAAPLTALLVSQDIPLPTQAGKTAPAPHEG